VTVEEDVTLLVVTAKVALVAPAGTVRLAGTVATPVLLLERETAAPPLGAGALKVTSPEAGDPPTTLLGVRLTDVRLGPVAGCGVTIRVAVWVTPEVAAEMVTFVVLLEAVVPTWKGTVVEPAGTLTLEGTVATELLLLERENVTPPLGAALFRVICPVEDLPPLTLVGLSATENCVV
jgi:hypothetical protein